MRTAIYLSAFLLAVASSALYAAAPTTINDFFLAGSQPNQSGNIEGPDRCDNCHGGYDIAVEPAFNWRGSMMAHAQRDPLYLACLTIANQDAPDAGDLCIRCHSPSGWLDGRSEPTDGSALNSSDRESVHCDVCHKLDAPTSPGVNPYPDDVAYTTGTYDADQNYLAVLSDIPPTSANGMFIVDSDGAKRGPYTDPEARHQFFYSPFHKEAALCGTCHDVSNPVYSRTSGMGYEPNDFDTPTTDFSPYSQFPIERTYSEWLMSDYNTSTGVYAPQFGGNLDTVRTCQDCHMRDTTGVGCNKSGVPVRDDLAIHDMTGGNTFIPLMLPDMFPGEVDDDALDSGIVRATSMLQKATSLDAVASVEGNQYRLDVTVTNETGHKLPSGYPEGRRIWLNVIAYSTSGAVVYESGAYDAASAVLTHDADAKIYEIKPGLSGSIAPVLGLTAGPSFHFAVNDTIYFDNRIPPRGFTNANYESIQSPPVGYAYPDGQYWDETSYVIPGSADSIDVVLYYQTTSKEYVEFLRDENVTNEWGDSLHTLWTNYGKSAPVVMNATALDVTPLVSNEPPEIVPVADTGIPEASELVITISADDPNGDPLALTGLNLPVNSSLTDNGDNTATFVFTPDYDQAGSYQVGVVATDGTLADTTFFWVTATNTNRRPQLTEIPDQVAVVDVLLQFDVTASDPDDDPLFLSIGQFPEGAEFTDFGNGTGSFTWTPTVDQVGDHELLFLVEDGSDLVEDTCVITVVVTGCCIGDRGNILLDEPGTGNCEDIADQTVDIGDLTNLVNHLFISFHPLCCEAEADISPRTAPDGVVDIGDLTELVNHLFISFEPLIPCQ